MKAIHPCWFQRDQKECPLWLTQKSVFHADYMFERFQYAFYKIGRRIYVQPRPELCWIIAITAPMRDVVMAISPLFLKYAAMGLSQCAASVAAYAEAIMDTPLRRAEAATLKAIIRAGKLPDLHKIFTIAETDLPGVEYYEVFEDLEGGQHANN